MVLLEILIMTLLMLVGAMLAGFTWVGEVVLAFIKWLKTMWDEHFADAPHRVITLAIAVALIICFAAISAADEARKERGESPRWSEPSAEVLPTPAMEILPYPSGKTSCIVSDGVVLGCLAPVENSQ